MSPLFLDFVDGLLGRMAQACDGLDGEPLGQGALDELFLLRADAIGSGLGGEALVAVFAAQPLGPSSVLSPIDDGLGLLALRARIDAVIAVVHASDSITFSTQRKL